MGELEVDENDVRDDLDLVLVVVVQGVVDFSAELFDDLASEDDVEVARVGWGYDLPLQIRPFQLLMLRVHLGEEELLHLISDTE